ncbi:MAG: hypothetical protein ACI814_004601, partial [Mariniblastus sp.]
SILTPRLTFNYFETTKRDNEARKRSEKTTNRQTIGKRPRHRSQPPRLLNDREQWHPDFYGSNLN